MEDTGEQTFLSHQAFILCKDRIQT